MKLKKFNQFVKKINEDFETEDSSPAEDFDNVEDFKNEVEDDFEVDDVDIDDVDIDDDSTQAPIEEETTEAAEEEEAHEYKGTLLLKDLANRLGTSVVNNQINYNGQKINYYSETEKFHIGKQKFDTVEEVVDFLNVDNEEQGIEESIKYIKNK